nr:unnamed protein product [Callosobruchus analis]
MGDWKFVKPDERRRSTLASNKSEKKQDLPTRGYYAEILTDNEYSDPLKKEYTGAHKKTKLIWQIKTEKHTPMVRQMVTPAKKAFLAPAERWMTFDEDKHISFPVNTFKPKVQLQHEVEPKTLPRNVAIEQLRREYQAQSLKKLLKQMNVTNKDLIPVEILRDHPENIGPTNLSSWTSFLPLELFDDEEYDVRTPENWLQHGVIDGVRYPLPGEAFLERASQNCEEECLFDTYEWMNVAVTDYNFETKKWIVLTLDGLQRTFEVQSYFTAVARLI